MRETDHPNGSRDAERWDDVFEALSAEPRRRVLVSLLDGKPGDAVHLPEAATAPDAPADSERLRVELYHQHLPTLADGGFVDWEADPLVATRGPDFPAVASVLESLDSAAVDIPDSPGDGRQGRPVGRRADLGRF